MEDSRSLGEEHGLRGIRENIVKGALFWKARSGGKAAEPQPVPWLSDSAKWLNNSNKAFGYIILQLQ